jgi:hypothetical protein
LLRYRTGSRYCRVGPEVMRMRDMVVESRVESRERKGEGRRVMGEG